MTSMTDTPPGLWRRAFGGLWWLVDGTRRLVLNLLFLALIAALLFAWWARSPARLQDKTALVLDLSGSIVEQRSVSARDAATQQLGGGAKGQIRLRDILAALDTAATDPKISSLLLLLDDFGSAGPATLHEVGAAMLRFRAGGKKVVAWASHYGQRDYYLAAHADEVLLHPMGLVYLEGYGSLRNYYRDAFDRLGVTAHVIRAGKFKNFGEAYVANAPSQETLAADKSLYDALWARYTDDIERARQLAPGSLVRGIEALPQALAAAGNDPARLALNAKLVDGLKTRDELRALMTERGARDESAKSFRQVDLDAYLGQHSPKTRGDAVGVVVAEGSIGDGIAPPGRIGGRSTAELIRRARDDDAIKALVLRVNSPGGSAFGAELIRRELELTRAAGKPVVVSMGDVAASGGYWIAMAADEVIADAATITGSIGVIALLPTAEGLMGKLSLHSGGYSTTWLAKAYDPRKPMDPRFAALVQGAVDHVYVDFIARAARSRQTTPEQIDALAQGRVWTGAQAAANGLIDRSGSFADALLAAAGRAKLAPGHRVAWIERAPGRLERLLGIFSGTHSAAAPWLAPLLGTEWPAAVALPWLAGELQHELPWLAELAERRQPFAAVAHCLCAPP